VTFLAGRRATTRIAWRQAKLAKWRSLLVVAMVGLPLMAMVAGGIVAVTVVPSAEEQARGDMGNADVIVDDLADVPPGEAAAMLPAGSAFTYRRSWIVETVTGGAVRFLQVFDVAVDDPVLGPMYQLVAGRAATAPDEMAVSAKVLADFDAGIGDWISLGPDQRRYRIVGEVREPEHLRDRFGLVAPGTLDDLAVVPEVTTEVFVDVPGVTGEEAMAQIARNDRLHGFGGSFDNADPDLAITGVLLGIAAIVLLETGLVAAAAFVVGSRRRLHTIGLVGAVGGEPRHARNLLLATGTVLGLMGSLAGIAAGIGIALVLSPFLDQLAGRVTGGLQYPPLLLAGALLLGTFAATVAALGPARAASRIPTVDALAGRTPPPRPPGKIARRGLVAVAAGAAATVWGSARSLPGVITAGTVTMVVGFLVVIPLLVTGVGRLAARLPLALRIAARDTARHGRRTGGAVAAAVVALAVPVMVATATLSSDAKSRTEPAMADDQILISLPTALPEQDQKAFLADLATEAFPGAVIARYHIALFGQTGGPDSPDWQGTDIIPAWVAGPPQEGRGGSTISWDGQVAIGDADTLRVLHAGDFIADLENGKAVVVGEHLIDGGVVHLILPFSEPGPGGNGPFGLPSLDLPAVLTDAGISPRGNLPGVVISPDEAAELGLVPAPWEAIVLRATSPLTPEQIARGRSVAARYPGASLTTRADLTFGADPLRKGALALAALSAVAIVGVAVALVAAESRRDHAILVAVGAGPGTRRKVVGATALLLAALAGIVAVPAGFLPTALIQNAAGEGYPLVVPWFEIFVVTLAVPALAGLVAAAVSRRPPAARMLRPLA
jgi:putative ABC transport system permease protein